MLFMLLKRQLFGVDLPETQGVDLPLIGRRCVAMGVVKGVVKGVVSGVTTGVPMGVVSGV